MDDVIREIACTSCAHRQVCKYKYEYSKVVETLRNSSISFEHDGLHAVKKVTSVMCVSSIDVLCKFFYEDEPI